MTTRSVVASVSQATRLMGSALRYASSTASEIRSQTLSGCPSDTDSLVKSQVLSLISFLSFCVSLFIMPTPRDAGVFLGSGRILARRAVRRVAEAGGQPFLRVGQVHALAPRVVLDLVGAEPADTEIARLGVGEIHPRHGRGGPHRERFCQPEAGVLGGLQQLEERALFGMVGA